MKVYDVHLEILKLDAQLEGLQVLNMPDEFSGLKAKLQKRRAELVDKISSTPLGPALKAS